MSTGFHLKRALVTGAGKGIGRGIALRLANMGAKVHAISRTEADLESLKTEYRDMEVYTVDITNWDKTRSVVTNIGPVDYLVNNAGVAIQTPFMDITKNELDKAVDTNLKAAFNISQVVVKGMIKAGRGGSIVNISSIVAFKPFDNVTLSCTTKAALSMLTKTMAAELGPHNIRVNSVNPGMVLTPSALRTSFGTEEGQRVWIRKTPLRKLVKVDDVIDATVFLLSDKSSAITGIEIPVDCGFIL